MKRGRPKFFLAKHRFLVEVLCMHGLSASRISRFMSAYGVPMTGAQVDWILRSAGIHRRGMTREQRQARLDMLRQSPKLTLPDEFYRAF